MRVMAVKSIGMLMSLVVDVLIAACLGTSTVADILIIALSLPRTIDIVAQQGTKFSLLALFVEMQHRLSSEEYNYIFTGVLNTFLAIGLICTVLGWGLAPKLIALVGPGLGLENKAQAAYLFRLNVPLTLFALGSAILETQLNSQRHFFIVATRSLVISTVVALAIGLNWSNPAVGTWIVGAYTVGYALFFGVLLWYSTNQANLRLDWRAWPDWNTLQQLGRAITFPIAGFGVRQGLKIVVRALTSLVSSGAVTAYYFAFRLVSAIQSIVGGSVAITGLPRITKYDLDGKEEKLGKNLRRWVRRVVLISLPITLGTLLFHNQIVILLYGRGAFDQDAIVQTGKVLQWLGCGVVFMCIIPVLNSVLYAQRRYSWVLGNMALVGIVNMLLAWWLSCFWGLVGIAIAVPASAALSVVSLWILVQSGRKRNGAKNTGE